MLDVIHYCVRCCAGQSDFFFLIYNMPFTALLLDNVSLTLVSVRVFVVK